MDKPTMTAMRQMFSKRLAQVRGEARRSWHELATGDTSTGAAAGAFAVGMLVSTIPLPVIDMALATLIMRRFGRLPRAPFVAAMALTNNLVMAPIYASTPKVGGFVMHWLGRHTPLSAPDAVALQVLVGYLTVALGLALGSFALVHTGLYGYRAAARR